MNGISSAALPEAPPKRRLLDQVRDTLRLLHNSLRTEETYVPWIRRYILYILCTHVLNRPGVGARSPADALELPVLERAPVDIPMG